MIAYTGTTADVYHWFYCYGNRGRGQQASEQSPKAERFSLLMRQCLAAQSYP